MTDDAELLRQYAQSGSETAFNCCLRGRKQVASLYERTCRRDLARRIRKRVVF
jgi:hypothetical protein